MKYLKNLLLSASILFLLQSCEHSNRTIELQKEATQNSAIENSIEFGKQILINKNGINYFIEFTDINDSRCPYYVECVWEGLAKVTLSIRAEDGTVKTGTLSTIDSNLKLQGLDIELLSVLPHPVDDEILAKEEYIITLDIQ